jgi:hypothetical protein
MAAPTWHDCSGQGCVCAAAGLRRISRPSRHAQRQSPPACRRRRWSCLTATPPSAMPTLLPGRRWAGCCATQPHGRGVRRSRRCGALRLLPRRLPSVRLYPPWPPLRARRCPLSTPLHPGLWMQQPAPPSRARRYPSRPWLPPACRSCPRQSQTPRASGCSPWRQPRPHSLPRLVLRPQLQLPLCLRRLSSCQTICRSLCVS